MQLHTNFGVVHRNRFFDGEYFNETQALMYAQITPLSGLQLRMFTRFGYQFDMRSILKFVIQYTDIERA